MTDSVRIQVGFTGAKITQTALNDQIRVPVIMNEATTVKVELTRVARISVEL